MASEEKEVWPPPTESRATRQQRIKDTLQFASSSKRKSIPKQQLQELLHRLQLDLKTEGNQLFEETKYIEARSCYDDVVNIQNLLISEGLEVNSLVAVNVRCNRAECLLRIGDEDSVKQALGDCNVVLGISPRDERAMFRKAKALKKLGKLPEAHQTVIDLGQFCKKAQVSELRKQIEGEIQEQQHQHSRNSAGLMNQWYLNGGLGAQQRVFDGHLRPHIPFGQPTFSYPRFPLLGPTAMPYFQPRVEGIRNHMPGTRTTSYPHVGLQSPFHGHTTVGKRQDGILGSPPPYSHYSNGNESRKGETRTTESLESAKNDREVDESWLPDTVKQTMKKKSDKNKKTSGMKGSRSRSASSSRQGISNNKQQARRNSEEKIGTKQKSRQDAKRDSSAIHVNSDLSTNPVPNNEVNNFRQHRKDQSQTVQCEARPSKQSTPEVSDKVQESQWITVTSKKGTAKNTMGQTPITTVVTERLNIKPTPDCSSTQSYNQGGGDTSSEQTTPLQPQSHSQEQPTVEASETEEDSGWTLVTSKKSSTKKIPNSQSAMPSMKLRPTSQGNQSTPKKTGSPQSSYTFQQTRSVSSKTPLLRTAVSDMANPPSADSLPMAFRQLLETNEFALACKQCFTQTPGQFGQGSYSFNQALDHTCWGDILLSCAKGARVFRWKKIRPRLNKKYTGKYWLCSEFENEEKCAVREDRCHYSHSQEEIDFWTKERQYKLKRSELETYLKHLPSYRTLNSNIDADVEPNAGDETLRSKAASTPWLGNAPFPNTITAPPLQKSIPMSSDTGGRLPGNKPAGTPTIHTPIVQPKKTKYKMEETRLPFQMKVVCKTCWESPLPNTVEATNGRETCVVCANKLLKEILIRSKQGRWIAVNSIPKVVINKNPSALRMCVHAKRGKDHYKIMTGRDCANPHSLEEMALWTWQWQNKVLSFKDLTTILQQNERARKQRFENSKSKTWQIRDDDFVPIDLTHGRPKSYNCEYCNKQCNSHFQLQQHFTSSSHKYRVMTDKDREHEWKHRPPPWNVHEDYLKLCARELKQSKSCPYGECTYAHSKEELHEWKERAAYRRMKIKRAKEQDVYSFVDALVEKYNDEQAHNVFSEDIEDVNIECKSELSTSLMKTEIRQKTTHDWKFKLSSDTVQLLQVGLLFDVHRQYFYLKDGKEKLQIASGSKFASEEGDYEVCVGFESQVFGSFHQGVVFSFGSEPVLLKQLTAHVGSSVALEEVHDMHHQTDVTAWNFMNSDIVKYDDPDSNDFDNGLLKKYKDPSSFKEQSVQLTKFELARKNYGHQMHRLLNVEELSQMKMIERFGCKTSITASRSITQETRFGTTARYAQGGQLFSKIHVGQELSDDYEAGRILLRSVNAVLIKPCNSESRVVYEAIVVSDQDFSGIDKQSVFIQLSEQSCKAMGLKHNQKIEVEIQFRINRLPFCRQHYAIDAIISHQLNVIFPQFHPMSEVTQRKLKKIKGVEMNRHQLLAARLVIERTPGVAKPLIIYGPFGTGKTFTIAMSIQQLVKEQPDARILVCTMSNSAADLYITQYLDKMVTDGYTLVRPLRIYARHRRVQTIPPVVAKYCQLQEVTGGYQEVRMPTTDDVNQIKDYSIVVTTLSNSMILKRIGLEGHFTHIFIDEAGQALETEAIIPLTLAGENTKIVLAGDHRQMSPEVYSEYARENKFHHSLLKRLFDIYLGEGKQGETCRVMLDENYRCHESILAFISRLFYGKELIASSNPPQKRHPEIYPLVFYSAYGEEILVGTSYHNVAEAQELVERVKWLCQNWPKEWGPAELNRIGVVSPYPAQVQQVRKSLRTLGLTEVTVESINNIQGKEYRALFISTVRTRKVTQTDDVDVKSLNLGFLSDRKLLNTAFTRAQSLVAVVGDPVALCSIGKCSNYWRKFISVCEKNQSIHPDTVTLQSIEHQVMSNRIKMNPKAVEFIPRNKNDKQVSQKKRATNDTKKSGHLGTNHRTSNSHMSCVRIVAEEKPPCEAPLPIPRSTSLSNTGEATGGDPSIFTTNNSKPNLDTIVLNDNSNQAANPDTSNVADDISFFTDSVLEDDEWASDDEEDFLDPSDIDEILKELARQLEETRQRYSEGRAFENVIDSDEEEVSGESREVFAGRENGPSEDGFQSSTTRNRTQRQLLGADYDDDYDSDSDDPLWDPYENESLETDKATLIEEFSEDELEEKLSLESCTYKRCRLYVEPSRTFAVTLNESEHMEIEITTRLKRGRALNNDEVAVEILNCQNDFKDGDERKSKIYGKVVGILERAMDPKLQKIACIIDEHSPRLMAPLNRSLPKMIWVTPRTDKHAKPKNSIPICTLTKARKLKVKRYEKVSNRDRPNKVFLVRYLRWHPRYRFPVCVVIDVLPYGDTLATGTEILKMAYGVKASYKTAAKQELARLYPDKWSIPPLEYHHRENLQHLDVFTVDPAESTDLDDALSIERLGENRYRVGIHIADVSFFVHRDSELDKEAFRRATSHYPWKQNPLHMLPSQLSTKLCSLIPDKDRLALTLFLTMSEDAEICEPPRMYRSIITSRAKLSYEDAENVINGDQGTNVIPRSVQESIDILHRLTCKLQANRLGDGQFCCRYESNDVAISPQAHSMVEELMLLANMQVASLLVSVFPNCTPLRRQKSPREDKLTDWKTKHRSQIPNSLDIVAKSELLQLQEFLQSEQAGDVDVLNTTWEKIVAAIQVDDTVELRKLLLNDLNHPQLAIMSTNYRQIQERAIYIASNNTSDERSHFSLNVTEYTHFTSPIRRYIDIIVHRLVIAYLTSQDSPYSEVNIKEICDNCNQQAAFAKEFERATMALHVATTLGENPTQTLAFISSTTDGSVELHVPEYNMQIPASERTINFSALQPCQKPVIQDENTPVTLEWKQRIYTNGEDIQYDVLNARRNDLLARRDSTPTLSPERYVKHIPGSMWREMMACIVRERRSTLRTVLHGISVILNNPSIRAQQRLRQQANYCTEVTTSEGMSSDEPEDRKQFCRFKRTYSCGDVVQIQLSTSMKKGTLSPVVQLFNMTPKLDICLEHRNDPIHSFAKVANERTAILRSRRNIVDYQRVWRNLLGMVSANGGVAAGETVTIHEVKVKWSKRDDCSNTYEGIFSLPATFCINRHIRFHTNDLACIRYHTNCDDDETAKPSRVNTRESTHQEGVACWTAHCVCTEVENLKSDKKRAINEVDRDENCTKIHVILHQSKTPMPEKLLKQNVRKLPLCTIEWIPIGSTDRHIATAIEKLPTVSVLVQDICLGRKITAADNRAALAVADTEIRLPRRPFYKLNPVQDQAVKTALCKPFTLIQGPPGTGKTVTGVHIAYWFVKMNQQSRLSDKDQVLYCGPSNKAVDVVTAYLKKIVPAIKILRVYGESIEHQSFPVPWMVVYPLRAGGNRITMSEEHRDVALHFLIRQPSNKYHAEIKHFDSIFRESRHSYNREDKSKYLRLISEAEKIELDRSDVILCTCAHSGTDRIAGTRIRQCIVDECGMCTEPDTVLPLVTNQPQQVVLVGDHKQLRPIVTEDMAKKLGMEISLLERYEDKAMMLTLQYRMHPGICQFPSDQFYQKRLETAQNVLDRREGLNIWPGGHDKPVVFCHIVGTEERQTVSTAEGGEQSRSNIEEVEQVVRMAITLVVRHRVNPASILIISQYRAQCSEITKRLKDKGHPNITVSTVIVSQGSEWDYVLFSTVRSLPRVEIEEKPSLGWLRGNLGFITDEHQINVAITRAKLGLIIVGNKELLMTHGMWKLLLQKYEQDGCLVYAREFLQLPVR